MMREPESGYLLCGQVGAQQLYERDDKEAISLARVAGGYTPEHRWFHVADGDDVYRYEDLLRDYGPENVRHLVLCESQQHGCAPDPWPSQP